MRNGEMEKWLNNETAKRRNGIYDLLVRVLGHLDNYIQ